MRSETRNRSRRVAGILDPIGYKIALELIVKGRFENVLELPIDFTDRRRGESKLDLREQWNYLCHLRRLYGFRLGRWFRGRRRPA